MIIISLKLEEYTLCCGVVYLDVQCRAKPLGQREEML